MLQMIKIKMELMNNKLQKKIKFNKNWPELINSAKLLVNSTNSQLSFL